MIRIETTAEFDTEGRFTVTAQGPKLTPGAHRVVVVVEKSVEAPVVTPSPSTLVREGTLLLLNAEPVEDVHCDIRALIDADREQRKMHILGDGKP